MKGARVPTAPGAFLKRLGRRFVQDGCFQLASSLAYASLLAIGPLVVLGFSAMASFQGAEALAEHVRRVLLAHLLPTSQQAVERYLAEIAHRAGALSIFGALGLLLTGAALWQMVEDAFNRIWRVRKKRTLWHQWLIFWAFLTLFPLFFGISITITTWFASLPLAREVQRGVEFLTQAPLLLPWLASAVGFFFAYLLLPNTRVDKRAAAIGGAVAGLLFELAKLGFAFYVAHMAHWQKLYGALAALPIFLVWLYLLWLIALFGAELAYCIEHPQAVRRLREDEVRFVALLAAAECAAGLAEGRLWCAQEAAQRWGVSRGLARYIGERLEDAGVFVRALCEAERECWTLAKDAHALSCAELFQRVAGALAAPPAWPALADSPLMERLHAQLAAAEQAMTERLGRCSLASLAEAMQQETSREP